MVIVYNVVAIIEVVSDWRAGSVAKSTSVREDMGLIPSTPRQFSNSSFKKSNSLFWPLSTTHAHGAQTFMYVFKIKMNNF